MFWAFDVLKHGAPALVGFLLGLASVAIIEPRTTDGKVLLIGTVICLTLVISFAIKGIMARVSSRRAGKSEEGDGP